MSVAKFLRTSNCAMKLEARVGIERNRHRNQPRYPELRGHFNAGFAGLQALSDTIRQLPDLTRPAPVFYSVIEETVEDFVEAF
jgi:hypothetical protein